MLNLLNIYVCVDQDGHRFYSFFRILNIHFEIAEKQSDVTLALSDQNKNAPIFNVLFSRRILSKQIVVEREIVLFDAQIGKKTVKNR